ncbi:50S ribosomal protein L11 methyltransferase [Lacticaseibacillus parakribbianus]|uniref:50S ribosomal protein L11 methyltransferase n=1 Tax=Lacticaseibacillus parakribbianus TaxID=2970927 RepID=UPI0021CB691B|nr:50S ribosomal protein L11 methyltransferase [Lacticaseibacillus parakribbianus]
MDYLAVTIETSSAAVDAVGEFMMAQGALGLSIEDAADATAAGLTPAHTGASVTGYFPAATDPKALAVTLADQVARLPEFGLPAGSAKLHVARIAEADWADNWKAYYQPLRVTRYLTIVPDWLDYAPQQPGELIMRLDPDMAFGTGNHPTTAAMLTLLEATVRGGETMIDVGTGSGVLALAGRLLGVASVLALDVDDAAVQNAAKNLALNPAVTGITVAANDLLAGVTTQADLIVANILAEVLLPLIPQVPARLAPGGTLLLSGIFHDKLEVVEAALADCGLTVTTRLRRGDWYALSATRPTA